MGPRRAFKWKHRMGPDGKATRIIRRRMALRGFRDAGAGALEAFASRRNGRPSTFCPRKGP
eukprot:1758181-Pyramimonas_sp.AAC.1